MRLESALEIIGALKRRFGEPLTVTDICEAVPLSYQPVHEYVRRLVALGALATRKAGQRLFCEPAATPAGSLWLAQWSLLERERLASGAATELAAELESRITTEATAAGAIVALEPSAEGRAEAYVTGGSAATGWAGPQARALTRRQFVELLRGGDRGFGFARRALPLCGQQLFWSIALDARELSEPKAETLPKPRRRKRRTFID